MTDSVQIDIYYRHRISTRFGAKKSNIESIFGSISKVDIEYRPDGQSNREEPKPAAVHLAGGSRASD